MFTRIYRLNVHSCHYSVKVAEPIEQNEIKKIDCSLFSVSYFPAGLRCYTFPIISVGRLVIYTGDT